MKHRLDPETDKVLAEGEMVTDFVKSDAWKHVKAKLQEKLTLIDSISNIPTEGLSSDQLLREVSVRAGAVSLILSWVREIEGLAQKHEYDREAMREARETAPVIRL